MVRAAAVALVLLVPAAGLAQVVPERELEITRALYEAANYGDALKRARAAMAVANFSDAQRVELNKIAALSAFNLGDTRTAQQHFLQLLQLNPDYVLDPFAVPPPAIKAFEQVKAENAEWLNLVRQQIALKLEQEKRAQAERERLKREEEERRRRLDELARGVTIREVQRRPWVVNLVPFGAGQFQQGRTGWGAAFATTEGVFLVMSVVSYFAFKSLVDLQAYEWVDRLTEDRTGRYRASFIGIPKARQTEAAVWRGLNIGAGLAFVAAWGLGAAEAFWRDTGDAVTERRETLPDAAPPGPKVELLLSPEGGGALFTFEF